ncbi:MAG: prenyltransferase [Sandaracinaceae bacterium]|nr:prenyltransferase [Sandaracinaceae bacterium]
MSEAAPGPKQMSTPRALWALSRPKGMLFVSILPMIGFAYAYWDHGCEDATLAPFGKMALLALVWAVPHAGTMWLNAGLDRDDKPTLFGDSVPVPAHIGWYAYPTFVFSIGLAFSLSIGLGVCVVLCTILSILYSHPKTAWKAHAWGGPFVNAAGYGALSPLGGFFLAGYAPTIRGAVVLAVAVTWITTAYFAAQAFQEDEDRERGYRTLVVTRGAAFTLRLTRGLFWVAGGSTLALAALGWFPRVVLVALPGFLWVDRLIAQWQREPKGGDESWARRFFLRMFWVAISVLVCVSVDYSWTRTETGRPGGLATASGHFEKRACE